MERIDWLNHWLSELDSKHPIDWDLLPDIGLYMDQVQTFIDRQLRLYQRDERERLLTPAMINNYIKDNLIPRAEAKKYNPSHLALLIMIGTLKQVLSIQNLNQLLSDCRKPDDIAALYKHFLAIQHQALQDNALQVLDETNQLRRAQANGAAAGDATGTDLPGAGESPDPARQESRNAEQTDALRNLALELGIEARVRILIAERILSLLDQPSGPEPSEKTERKKGRN